MSADPIAEMQKQIDKMKQDVELLTASTVGDRNYIEQFKQTLRGRIEELERSALKLVLRTDYDELAEIVEVNSKTVDKIVGVLNWAVKIFFGALIVGLAAVVGGRLWGS